MKKIVLITFGILLIGLFSFSCKPDDGKLQKQVETALSTAYKGISSTVKGGVATLQGTVDSEEAKAAIEKAASAIKGVKSIVNNITVKIPEPEVIISPDDVLTTTIKTALSLAGYKDVSLAVKNSEVTLTGSVKKSDLAKVMQIANEANPKKVINELKVVK